MRSDVPCGAPARISAQGAWPRWSVGLLMALGFTLLISAGCLGRFELPVNAASDGQPLSATVTAMPTLPSGLILPEPAGPLNTPMPPVWPSIVISPTTGAAGTLIAVTGDGWQAADQVSLLLQSPARPGLALEYSSIVANGQGHFLAVFAFPTDPAWASLPFAIVTALSQRTGGRVAQARFILAAPAAAPGVLPAATLTVATPWPARPPVLAPGH